MSLTSTGKVHKNNCFGFKKIIKGHKRTFFVEHLRINFVKKLKPKFSHFQQQKTFYKYRFSKQQNWNFKRSIQTTTTYKKASFKG